MNRIADRFPSIYKTWDENSLIFKFLHAFAKRFEESQKDAARMLRGHWIDTARGGDLDRLGALFNLTRGRGEGDNDFRDRIKNAIQEYRGGGTVKAIQSSLTAVLDLEADERVEIVENPPKKMRVEKKVRAGTIWSISSNSIEDVKPTITISVVEENAEANHPTLQNLATGETILYKGTLKTGQELVLKDRKATLDKTDATKQTAGTGTPTLTRRTTEWQYTEALSEKIGVFDSAVFNESIFAVGIPEVSIQYQWTALLPATFEVHASKAALTRSGVDEEALGKLINQVKASGVTAIIKTSK